MSEEIKIITLGDIFKNIETEEKAFKFKDYIRDLQQKVEQLEKENEYLKMSNSEQNMEHFRIVKENKRKIDNLRKQNKELLKKSYSDDVKITKAIEFIKEEQQLTDIDEVINTDALLNILNKGDNNVKDKR